MRELELLQLIYDANARLPDLVVIPPGDDMAGLSIGGSVLLLTVDQLADGVHVQLDQTPVEKVGRKAVARSLSDIAAMAARPVAAIVTACLSRNLEQDQAKQLFEAMRSTAEDFGCALVGGDIAMWDAPLLLTVTIVGEPDGVDPVLRCGAKVGDAVFVTGRLGGSLESIDGGAHHLDFEPRIELARQLATREQTRPHCMIDLSDGLARDLSHLCAASKVSARLDAGRLPISIAAEYGAQRDHQPPWAHAIGDGEDYELLFSIAAERVDSMPSEIEGVPITRIGTIEPLGIGPPAVLCFPDGSTVDMKDFGWEHKR